MRVSGYGDTQIYEVRRAAEAHPTGKWLAGREGWAGWPRNFSHILVIGEAAAEAEALDGIARRLAHGSFFALYEGLDAASAPAAKGNAGQGGP